jgi:hypothetical protein
MAHFYIITHIDTQWTAPGTGTAYLGAVAACMELQCALVRMSVSSSHDKGVFVCLCV